ncbi:MAG TPA: tRNA pseudouridine(55) synthase TruB, partial [Candidatus Omnitrophota bacterium]|nr:tRNA pseudouridine(55) synthase TruB [Candidatus Omnitrophota bacterium]
MTQQNRDGIIVVNKPRGFTSHDVVAVVRRRLDMKKVGHAGTLDPIATGVLVILVGKATRLFDVFLRYDKE